jgi:hypothetical protein
MFHVEQSFAALPNEVTVASPLSIRLCGDLRLAGVWVKALFDGMWKRLGTSRG